MKFEVDVLDGLSNPKIPCVVSVERDSFKRLCGFASEAFEMKFADTNITKGYRFRSDDPRFKESPLYKLFRKMKRKSPQIDYDFDIFLDVLDITPELIAYCILEYSKNNSVIKVSRKVTKIFKAKERNKEGGKK